MGLEGRVLQQLANGVILGSVYALLALGYSMVYGILRVLNFAHGDVFMASSFAGWVVAGALIRSGAALPPLLLTLIVMVSAMCFGGLMGLGVERVAYRPLRGASRLAPLLSAIGVSIFIQNVVMLMTQGRAEVYETELMMPSSMYVRLGSVSVPFSGVLIVVVAGLLTVSLNYVVRRTTLGKMMRAVSEDPGASRYMGIPVNKVIACTFLLGSSLAGAAGVLIGLYYMQIDFAMGFSAGMKAFTAAVLGGIGSLGGAVLGGILLGTAESLGTALISPVYKDAIAFGVLILALILRPQGILGENVVEKV